MPRTNKVSVFFNDKEIAAIRHLAESDRPREVGKMIRFLVVRRALALRNMAAAMERDPKLTKLIAEVVKNLSDEDIEALS